MKPRPQDDAPPSAERALVLPIGHLLREEGDGYEVVEFDVPTGGWVDDAQLQGAVEGRASIAHTTEGLVVTIEELRGTHAQSCVRCLTPLVRSFSLPRATRLFAFTPDDDTPPGLDQARQVLDLRPLLREELLIAAPQAPLCADDCPGLCQHCGARRADSPCGHPQVEEAPPAEQPLAKLAALWKQQG